MLNNPILDGALSESMIFFMNLGLVPRGFERLSSGDPLEVVVAMNGEERNEDPFGTVPTDILTIQHETKRCTLTG